MALPMALLDGPLFSQPQDISVHPRASLSRPGTLSSPPRNQDIAVLLNAFDFRRSPGYGSGTTSLGSSSSGHSHASHFSASGSGHSRVQHAKAPGGELGKFGFPAQSCVRSRAPSRKLGRPHASGEPHISLRRDIYTSLRGSSPTMHFVGGRVARDVAGAASKHGLLLVDWWFGMQGFPRAFCGITANRGLFWGICGLGCRESRGLVGFAFILAGWGGEFWHEVCVVVGVVVGQGLMSVFVGVFSMFSGCPPPFHRRPFPTLRDLN